MSLSMRRTVAVLLGVAILAGLTFLPSATGQPVLKRPPRPAPIDGLPGEPRDPSEVGNALTLPMADKTTKDNVLAAPDYIAAKKWTEAIDLLQRLVDRKEDVFVEVKHKDAGGKESATLVSVRAEGNRLISTLPPEGLEFYRVTYNPKAKALLKQARASGDPDLLEQVSRRYLYTESGVEATNLLLSYYLDHGQYVVAALCFDRLQEREGTDKLSPGTLLRGAVAYHHAQDRKKEEQVWKDLKEKVGSNLQVGGKTVALDDLRDDLGKYKTVADFTIYDWAMYRGDATRSAQSNGGKPFLEKDWSKSPFTGLSDFTREDNPPSKVQIQDAVKAQEGRGHPILPAFFPIAADNKLVYRSYWGIHAVDIKTGKLIWETESKGSLEKLLKNGPTAQYVNNWIGQYKNMGKANALYENSANGTLSTDNSLVYAVEDLALAPITSTNPYNGMPWGGPMPQPNQTPIGPLTDALYHNKLVAYDLKTGKLRWEAGGRDKEKAGELVDTFFLGPPLPMHGKLYVLTEKNQELRLLCLDPRVESDPTKSEKPEIVWSQKLADARDKMVADVARRMHAAHLAYGEGILVCPTNAGAVLGVDLLSQSLVWVHSYREKGQLTSQEEDMIKMGMMPMPPGYQPRAPNATEWKVSAPVISDGKVVVTAPDGRGIDCLNLRDGSVVWKVNRTEDDLYLGGVVKGKVLVVTKKSCRALNLVDGKQAWQVETGIPSGQGVASEENNGAILYYLPLKAATTIKDKEPIPAVAVIDVEKGALKATTRSRKKEVPGNLLFYEGTVISQGVDEVAAFPQRDLKEAEITRRLAENPNDPKGLSERADIALDGGNWQGAVDDLKTALAVLKDKPDADTETKARDKLFESLTEYLQHDFDKAEKYIDEYKGLCKIAVDVAANADDRAKADAETRRRTATFLSLVGRGREGQGRLGDAFDAYLEYGTLASGPELLSVDEDRSVKAPANVWAQGRIGAMIRKAPAEQRARLEQKIGERWKEVREAAGSNPDLEPVRRFVAVFGVQSKVGRDARLYLAERLMNENGAHTLIEAEQQLLALRRQEEDPGMAGLAVESLARLMARKGLLEDAAHFYRVLGRDFAKVVVRDGKTGADIFNDLATDKRFLAYVDEPGQAWQGGALQGKTENTNGLVGPQRQMYVFEPAGEVLPFFQKHRVALDFQFHALKLTDRTTNAETWSVNLTRTMFQNFLWMGVNPNNPPRYPYHTVGHVIVLPLAHLVFGIDPLSKQVLWEKSLTGSAQAPQPNGNNLSVDPKDGTLTILYPDGYVQKLGQTGPIEASYVCLQTRDGLLALDPTSGKTLWTRSDVSTRAGLFGDGENVYVVDVNGDGTPARTRAFRAQDGVGVDVPDFTTAYQQRQRIFGRKILASGQDKGKLVVRIYDPKTGKDDWRKEFAANSTLLQSDEPNLAGVVEPDGKLTVVDLTTQKEVLRNNLNPKDLEKVQGITLLGDRERFYVAVNGPVDQNIMNWGGGIMPNLMPNFGYRQVPVNGEVYAFDRHTEKLKWRDRVENQMLLLNEFADAPALLFTSRYTTNNGGRFMQEVAVKAIMKWNGKLVFDEKLNQNTQQFQEFKIDLKARKIELLAWNLRVTLTPKDK
jgi:outer membrane protein assembly factor BamB